ncbi:hypothetical protein LTR09_007335 [Extremus antarcticus]|uniref:Uncharacterized protein n=1 Tax=Extremus antarcticus TaxID=702011 RepID=A0AAJ0DDD4_9PEZI|nr:hypothetical protein LTR09_007335 [Extremus antarcticus]
MRAAGRDQIIAKDGAITRYLLVFAWWVSTLPLWTLRIWSGDSTWLQDLILCLSLHTFYGFLTGALRFFRPSDFGWIINLDSHELWIYLEIFSLLGVCGGFAGGIVHRGHQLKAAEEHGYPNNPSIDEQLLPPLLIASRTTHSRIFPKKHSFSYSYLYVGIPVDARGRVSQALSVDSERPSWFDVRSAEYLVRGSAHLGLAGKLKQYLHTQGVTDREYSFAYLVTAPRFLGYSFNPVSFWYLYDSDAVLKYMILEVNNTFDERRMYLLRAGESEVGSTDETASDGRTNGRLTQVTFTQTFDKDFHVSPFNSRKGSYSLRATDPLASFEKNGQYTFDNTIVLRSSKESAKIVARVFSDGTPKDASTITQFELYGFIASWWWVGFITFPRIVRQARKLFFQRKLHVWYRPEVTETSVSRPYTSDEAVLEKYFRAFLDDAVAHAQSPLRLNYIPVHAQEIAMYSPGFTYEEDQMGTLTIRVISPSFYSRFVHYAHAKEAFDRECMSTDEKNRTVTIESPALLPILLQGMSKSAASRTTRKQNIIDQTRCSFLRRLRCPPPLATYPTPAEYSVSDIRAFGDAELDLFVKSVGEESARYRRVCVKQFLATRFAFGLPGLVETFDWLLRAASILATLVYCRHFAPLDIFRPRAFDVWDVWTTGALMVLANGVHIWSLIKG